MYDLTLTHKHNFPILPYHKSKFLSIAFLATWIGLIVASVLIIAGLVIAGGITAWIAVMVVLPFALLAILLRWLFGKKNPPSDA